MGICEREWVEGGGRVRVSMSECGQLVWMESYKFLIREHQTMRLLMVTIFKHVISVPNVSAGTRMYTEWCVCEMHILIIICKKIA